MQRMLEAYHTLIRRPPRISHPLPLRQERRLINADTGAMVHDQDKVTVFQAGPKVTPDRFPQNVSVDAPPPRPTKAGPWIQPYTGT